MKEKNKELGREEFVEKWVNKEIDFDYDDLIEMLKEYDELIQQSEQKPEIDEKWIEEKAMELNNEILLEQYRGGYFKICKDFIRQIVAEALSRKKKSGFEIGIYIDDILDDIIEAVIEHADCHHAVDHDEDGVHTTKEYSLDNEEKVKEKLRKILNKGGD